MIRNVNTDLAAGILGLALSIAFWWLIDPDITRTSIIFPKIIIIFMGSISLLLAVKGLSKTAERKDLFTVGNNVRIVVTGLLFFGWAVAIGYLGFFVSSVVSMLLIAQYLSWGSQSINPAKLALWFGIVTCEVAVFFFIFSRLLYVQLPEGWFF